MLLKSLHLKNFGCYKDYKVSFSTLNFIRGNNGAGKTTLGVDALLFVLFGYTRNSLKDLPTRNVSSSCAVTAEIEINGHEYIITRKYPSDLVIIKDGEYLEISSVELNNVLKETFGLAVNFKKFRLIDSSIGVNFLEEGEIALKKTLFALQNDKFNEVRASIQEKKRIREIYNKDIALVCSHYPSEKRLEKLNVKLANLDVESSEIKEEIEEIKNDIITHNRQQARLEVRKNTLKIQRDRLLTANKCYACNQLVQTENKDEILKQINSELISINDNGNNIQSILEELNEIKAQKESGLNVFISKYNKLDKLRTKLTTRIKQKDYKYTTKDVETMKVAIKELDNMSSKYLVNSVKSLEPIINSIISKINMTLEFDIDSKNKFRMSLTRENINYSYKDLSAGQKIILQIALKIALLLQNNESGLLIADEGFSNLDEDNLSHILKILEQYPIQLIFMLHNIIEVPNNVKIIEVEKKEE